MVDYLTVLLQCMSIALFSYKLVLIQIGQVNYTNCTDLFLDIGLKSVILGLSYLHCNYPMTEQTQFLIWKLLGVVQSMLSITIITKLVYGRSSVIVKVFEWAIFIGLWFTYLISEPYGHYIVFCIPIIIESLGVLFHCLL